MNHEPHEKMSHVYSEDDDWVTTADDCEKQQLLSTDAACDDDSWRQERRVQHKTPREYREILESLSIPGLWARHRYLADKTHSGTFEWIFGEPDQSSSDIATQSPGWDSFTGWLRGEGKTYWISGKPATGKSTLAKFVASHNMTSVALHQWQDKAIIISHYFWRAGSPLQRSIKGMLFCMAHHLLENREHEFREHLLPRYNDKWEFLDWTVSELRQLLKHLFALNLVPVLLVVDGIDEIEAETDIDEVLQFLMEAAANDLVKLCLVSRREPSLSTKLIDTPGLCLEQLNRRDLSRFAKDYIKTALERRDEVSSEPGHDFAITLEQLVDHADGDFLWLRSVLPKLTECIECRGTHQEVEAIMCNLPKDMSSAIQMMLEKANGEDDSQWERAGLYLKLVLVGLWCNDSTGLQMDAVVVSMVANHHISLRLLQGLSCHRMPDASEMTRSYNQTRRNVVARCAGLLDFVGPHTYGTRDMGRFIMGFHPIDRYFGGPAVQFTHRVILDHFSQSAVSSGVLGCNSTSEIELALELHRAMLAHCRVFLMSREDGYDMGRAAESRDVAWHVSWLTRMSATARAKGLELDRQAWMENYKHVEHFSSISLVSCFASKKEFGELQGIEFVQWAALGADPYTTWMAEHARETIRDKGIDQTSLTMTLSWALQSQGLCKPGSPSAEPLADLCCFLLEAGARLELDSSARKSASAVRVVGRRTDFMLSLRAPMEAMVMSMAAVLSSPSLVPSRGSWTSLHGWSRGWVRVFRKVVEKADDALLEKTVLLELRIDPGGEDLRVWVRVRAARVMGAFLRKIRHALSEPDDQLGHMQARLDALGAGSRSGRRTMETCEVVYRFDDNQVLLLPCAKPCQELSSRLLCYLQASLASETPFFGWDLSLQDAVLRDLSEAWRHDAGHGPLGARLAALGLIEPVQWLESEINAVCVQPHLSKTTGKRPAKEYDYGSLCLRPAQYELPRMQPWWIKGFRATASKHEREALERHRGCCQEWVELILDAPEDKLRGMDWLQLHGEMLSNKSSFTLLPSLVSEIVESSTWWLRQLSSMFDR